MRTRILAGLLLCIALCAQNASLCAQQTPLDIYVATDDPAYSWTENSAFAGDGWTAHVLDMTSQSWVTPQPADRTEWRHWLVVYQPNEVKSDVGLLFISGGANDDKAPAKPNDNLVKMATTTGTVTAELRMVPNQPLSYEDDSFGPRKEDEIISYDWRHFLDEGDPIWLTRLPMTKAAVRAMDTITAFDQRVQRFYVMGASKRGWTTWTTAAADHRVIGISPIVIDLLNLKPSFIHHYRAYGSWAPAVGDYYREGVMDRMETAEFKRLIDIVDPYSYRDRYTLPKFIVNAAGDQFFLPDSSQFYFDDLPGEKYLRYIPNTDHSLRGTDAFDSLTAFYHAVLNGDARPRFDWRFEADGSIGVTVDDKPTAVKLWQAHNPRDRDFRLEAVGPIYQSTDLTPDADGSYTARVEPPASGFTAYFIELIFPSGLAQPFKFTTGVRVTPDKYPYAAPMPGKTRLGPNKQAAAHP